MGDEPDMTIESEPTERKLATLEQVADLEPIEGADRIELARIRGWEVVVGKGDFQVGDRCVYIEIDSLLDTSRPAFASLAARGKRTDAIGRRGHVLKTVKLRGVYSQGIAYPITKFPPQEFPDLPDLSAAPIGSDLTAALGVVLWQPPLPVSMAGELIAFPGRVPKTDEERLQNIPQMLAVMDVTWVATEKIDGTSTTFALDQDGFAVAGHNWGIAFNPENALWQLAEQYGIEAKLRDWAEAAGLASVAVQGESYGEKIQGNPLKVRGLHWSAFNVIAEGRRLPRDQWPDFALELSVPVIADLVVPPTVAEALEQANALASLVNPAVRAEGIVWRSPSQSDVRLPDGTVETASFKVVSNRYLLKHDR
ncbi:MAG: RNA ligase (ATP) [Bifidobacteriaceae bacterium]|jgi:RNA ligase (TIGR02306 family)|nr:RNA ligase (ATP) [Bifidobacteriaceae bacterium]